MANFASIRSFAKTLGYCGDNLIEKAHWTRRRLVIRETDHASCQVAVAQSTNRFLAEIQIGDPSFRAGSVVNTLRIRPIAQPAQSLDFFCHPANVSKSPAWTLWRSNS